MLVLGLIVIGAVAQRVAGLGFAMLVSPFLVLLLGPHLGVFLINVFGTASSLLIIPRVWRDIDWSMYRWLVVSALIGVVPGALIAAIMPSGVLSTVIGALVLLALLASLLLSRADVVVTGKPARAVAGWLSGATTAMAGVGGPAVSAYAVLARWPQRSFAATLQPFFASVASATVVAKLIVDPARTPVLDWWMWILMVLAIVIGIFGGEWLGRYISDRNARLFVLLLAFAGAIMTLVKGITELV
ncbi:hypothetical protein GCM10008096_21610 [Zhihengliuella salsuginis]|uniref:Probable membrane transporter protein n=1 Tax=Zhihengliuella salsuginis TaxID=578222 RepID=A0ABQ3GL29_9MICC|nr:hypothetical protein GCM10008096_21610 [Zhihengliuella salsuginis]